MQNNRARSDDTVIPFDRRQSPVAAELQRGVCRRFRALGFSVVTELSLANGRRADVVALSGGGDIIIVEIKSCLLDYQSDGKWQDYLPFCDRLYFAVAADFPCEVIPVQAGLILADRYGAELVREPVEERLAAARRKAMMLMLRSRRRAQACSSTSIPCGFEVCRLQLARLTLRRPRCGRPKGHDVKSERYFGARLARIRCNVRRCMLSRRAVSDTLRLQSS